MEQANGKNLDRFEAHLKRINEELNGTLDSRIGLVEDIRKHALLGNGKRLRPLFFILCCLLCKYTGNELYRFSTIFEYLHAASLLHDDVLDNAYMRRNRPSANNLWGNRAAVLEGDFLASKTFSIAMSSNNPEIIHELTRVAARMAEGQMLEMLQTGEWNTSKETYMEIIKAKTAVLISAACSCGAIISGAGKEAENSLGDFGLNVGIAFQLIDDLKDYTSSEDKMGKPVGNDLREGKMTLPLIYLFSGIEKGERERISELLRKKNATDQDYQTLIASVRKNGVTARVQEEAGFHIKRSIENLNSFPDTPFKRDLLYLAWYTLEREC